MSGKLNQSQRIALVSNNPSLFTGTTIDQLAPGQFGLFYRDKEGYQFLGTKSPTHARDRKFKLALGMKNHFNPLTQRAQLPTWNHESVEFKASEIVSWRGIKAHKATKEPRVALGFDGVDLSKSLKVKVGQSFKLYMYLSGFPINQLTGFNRRLVREYIIDPEWPAVCQDGCDTPQCQEQACQVVQQKIVEAVERDMYNNGIPITNFVKVSTVTSCDPALPEIEDLVEFDYYQLTIYDDGSRNALGEVADQYPSFHVEQVARHGNQSTYQLTQLASAQAPAAYTSKSLAILPDCTDCPSGFTLEAANKAFEIIVPKATSVTTSFVSGITAVKELGSTITQKTIQVTFAATVDEDAKAAALRQAGAVEVHYMGEKQALCKQSQAVTVSWTQTSSCFKASKSYHITLGDKVCGGNRLAELQAAYPSYTISVAATGECVHQYQTTVYSNCVTPGCSVDLYKWQAPASYDGNQWEADPPTSSVNTTCNCGVIFEGARFEQPVDDCTLPYFGYDNRMDDPVKIELSTHTHDYLEHPLETKDMPVTYLQTADYNQGWGRDVIIEEQDSMGYFMKKYHHYPVLRQVFDANYQAKPNIFYDEYQLKVKIRSIDGGWFDDTGFQILYRFFVPTGEGKELEGAINQLIVSAGLNLDLVYL